MKRFSMILVALSMAFSVASATTITLLPPPGVILLGGVSCGGQHVSTWVTGFEADGNIAGTIYAWTSCSSGGRGSVPRVYRGYYDTKWDLSGNSLGLFYPYSGGKLDPYFTATDDAGDTIYNVRYTTFYGGLWHGMLETAQ